MRKLGGSQPNLSTLAVTTDISVSDDEDDFVKDDSSPKGLYPSLRQRVLSNPNLLDCDEPVKVRYGFRSLTTTRMSSGIQLNSIHCSVAGSRTSGSHCSEEERHGRRMGEPDSPNPRVQMKMSLEHNSKTITTSLVQDVKSQICDASKPQRGCDIMTSSCC